MKRWFVVLVLLAPGVAFAQTPAGMEEMMRRMQDPAEMERMVKEAQAAQECMGGISQAELDALRKKGEAASREVDALCAAGRKSEALAKALALSNEMRANPTVKQLRECTEGMSEMLKGMPFAGVPGVEDDTEPTESDICS